MKVLAFVALVWLIAVCVHLLWEAWIIARRGLLELPVCRHWWCPDGILNRWKGNQ